ncbi:MAG TPA: DNA mismatch repair protein MutS [Candidatus Rhabdochlamydia sp.]|jgi:DNA mismatch repair protein MutS|nr:DNA mismatch repair protein MutS [Candidatus Rhabdochlamydia sp.]
MKEEKPSSMMTQWHHCKKQAGNALLLFRLGDFYEAFENDAVLLSKQLGITLTKRQDIPMAGIPFHTSDAYIDKLVAKGYRIAIAEQLEDPQSAKGILKREVVKIITPGTIVHSNLLSAKSNNFLGCFIQINEAFGLAVLDVTTSEFRAMEFEDKKQLFDELSRIQPKELLLPQKWMTQHPHFLEEIDRQFKPAIHLKEAWHFEHKHACDVLLRHFQIGSLDGFGLTGMVAAINAAGAILHYVQDELNLPIQHIKSIKKEHSSCYMLLDRTTQRHLELFQSIQDIDSSHTLLQVIDYTLTPMGGRLLKYWLAHPLLDLAEIQQRQDGIEEFLSKWHFSEQVLEHLKEIRDLERLIMRIETDYATPRDLGVFRLSLEQIAPIFHIFENHFSSRLITKNKTNLKDVSNLVQLLQKALIDTPPLKLKEAEIFRIGFSEELDHLQSIKQDSHNWIAQYQTQLRQETQIKNLKVGYTKAFGFFIELNRGKTEKIPSSFQRRQTLVNAERFTTLELKEYEHKILHIEERICALEYALFTQLKKQIAEYASLIYLIARAIAEIDVICSLAQIAKLQKYIKPTVNSSDLFHIEEGRHPVIETVMKKELFIPNDVLLNATSHRLHLITGPNMAGKSTFIRQVALIAILAQMGSFVPAKNATIGIIDKVFSRIGASDDLAKGLSTFMVEMTETANILNNVTDRSLVILDEIGRGTSTYDGISIAWSVAEYLLTQSGKQAKTLFATHFWELTELEQKIPGAVNYSVSAHESENKIVFLHKVIKGGTDKSYGIHVARLAGLPYFVIKRAQQMLKGLEQTSMTKPKAEKQLCLFINAEAENKPDILGELKEIDPNNLTPLAALQKLIDWKERVK